MSDRMPTLLRGDARSLPLADNSVDLVVTSPPYFGLRSYTDGGEHYGAQIGSEATPREFIAALIECTREMVRVLKPTGSIFVNLGDKYSGAQGQTNSGFGQTSRTVSSAATWRQTDPKRTGIPNKSLMLLPERYRIACVDELGLLARAVVIWAKPNGLPESVTDRVRRSHEDWVHLTKESRYYSAVDEIRELHVKAHAGRLSSGRAFEEKRNGDRAGVNAAHMDGNPLGKLPGSVWEIATQPLKVPAELGIDHFAAFPMEWPRRIIQGWSPREVCSACGEGRRPVVDKPRSGGFIPDPSNKVAGASANGPVRNRRYREMVAAGVRPTITRYACDCADTSARSTPGIVLDPFGGTGTTALVATMLGRVGISVDASADYCRLAQWRASDPKERARADGLDPDAVSRIKPQTPGQVSMLDLFNEGGAA